MRRPLLSATILAVVCGTTAAYAGSPDEGVLTIGLAAPLTGDSVPYSEAEGARCMADMVNAKAGAGDIKVKVLVEDGQSKDDVSLKVAEKFMGGGAVVVHGNPFPSTLIPLAEMALERNAMVFTPQTAQAEMNQLDLVNLVVGVAPDDVQASVLAANAFDAGVRTAVLMVADTNDSWLASTPEWFGASLEHRGGRVLGRLKYQVDSTDFSTHIPQILDMAPDAVHICLTGQGAGTFVNQLAGAGYTGRIYGCDGLDDVAFEQAVTDKAVRDRITFNVHVAAIDGTPGGEFLKACQAKGFKSVSTFDVLGGEMVELLVMAAKDAGTTADAAKLMQAIRSRPKFDLFTGVSLSYAEATYPKRPVTLMGYRNGQRYVVETRAADFAPLSK